MARYIRVIEPASTLNARILLNDDLAPQSAEALWQIAGGEGAHFAQHAMWTGPEISCPILKPRFPASPLFDDIPLENATSFPPIGAIATVFARKGTWAGMPPHDLFDIGLFYGPGARMLMPMGWIMASIAGQVVDEDLADFQTGCQAIRRDGVCELRFEQLP
ncbi:MAG: DUF3830 family protein [Sphingobium sp.]